MFIYNITSMVTHAVHEEWLNWMKETHIPHIMQSGCFTHFQFVKLLDTDETEGVTYAVQYYAESKADYNRYIELHAPALREESNSKWGENIVSFRTFMSIVH